MDTAKTERAPLKVRKDRTDRPLKTKENDLRSKESAHSKGYDFSPKTFKFKVEYSTSSDAWLLVKEVNSLEEANALIRSKKSIVHTKTTALQFRIWDNVKNAPVEG